MVTAEEKHQLICGNCRFKFAHRNRDACPRCKTPIDKMANPVFLHYTYYHCTKSQNPDCDEKSISAGELERQIADHLARIQISGRFKTWAIKYLHELHEKESASRNDVIRTQQRAYQECLRRLDSLVRLRTASDNADGSLISDDEYARQRLEVLKDKSQLEELLRDAGHRVEIWLRSSEQVFEFACTARTRFANGDAKTKKEILAAIGSNLTLKGRRLWIEARKPFLILEKSISGSDHENEAIEPENVVSSQGQNGNTPPLRPNVLGDLHEVRNYGSAERFLVASIYRFFRSAPDLHPFIWN